MRPRSIHAALLAVAVLLTGVGVVAGAAPAAAAAVPPAPRAATGIDAPAAYVPAISCDTTLKSGTAALANLLTRTYAGTSAGTVRSCLTDGSTSEHYDGRAIDWMTTVRTPTGRDRGDTLVNWLLATDARGNAFANARRLGVMYIIWDGKIWGAYRPSEGWRPYSSCASHPEAGWDTTCHRDHVHLSLSWEGAMGRTSYWTGTVPARDYGPCRVADLSWAPPYATARSTVCPSVPAPTVPAGASALTRQLIGYSGMILRPGATGTPVAAVNQSLGVAGSTFSTATSTAVRARQTAARIPVTGILDVATWRVLLHHTTPPTTTQPTPPAVPAVTADLTGDRKADLLATSANGNLYSYAGTGSGGFGAARLVGSGGWDLFDNLTNMPGFSGNGKATLVGRRRSDGALFLWPTAANGTVGTGRKVSSRSMSQYSSLFAPGDLTGDGKADLLGLGRDGSMMLFTGNGAAGWNGNRVVLTGLQNFKQFIAAGDFTGDGKKDILGIGKDGTLWLYPGTGTGAFQPRRLVGTGWSGFTAVVSPSDVSGDGRPDLIARMSDGRAVLHTSNGAGALTGSRQIATGWNSLSQLLLVG